MPCSEFDFIIVGQGLAGTLLASALLKGGQSVMVLDNAHHGSSTKVAAGIINPITGHRLNISEGFFDYYRVAQNCYIELEITTQQTFFRPIQQSRLIKNKGQYDYLEKRLLEPDYQELLKISESSVFKDGEFGAIDVNQTAVVDTKSLLRAGKQWLISKNSYSQHVVDYSAIKATQSGVSIAKYKSKKIIFCEGYQAVINPWLKHLPFKPAKGEILTLDLIEKCPDRMLNWGQWLVPAANNQRTARLGSNFIWNDLRLTTSEETKLKMQHSLIKATGLSGELVKHEVGIRPTTIDRLPFVGSLSNLENAYCFNGFGSKGCLLVPYYAELMTQHLLHKKSLPTGISKWV